jgi:hypothetical protein
MFDAHFKELSNLGKSLESAQNSESKWIMTLCRVSVDWNISVVNKIRWLLTALYSCATDGLCLVVRGLGVEGGGGGGGGVGGGRMISSTISPWVKAEWWQTCKFPIHLTDLSAIHNFYIVTWSGRAHPTLSPPLKPSWNHHPRWFDWLGPWGLKGAAALNGCDRDLTSTWLYSFTFVSWYIHTSRPIAQVPVLTGQHAHYKPTL